MWWISTYILKTCSCETMLPEWKQTNSGYNEWKLVHTNEIKSLVFNDYKGNILLVSILSPNGHVSAWDNNKVKRNQINQMLLMWWINCTVLAWIPDVFLTVLGSCTYIICIQRLQSVIPGSVYIHRWDCRWPQLDFSTTVGIPV